MQQQQTSLNNFNQEEKTSANTLYSFDADQAQLPKVVLKQYQKDMMNWNLTGVSILEASHRSAIFTAYYKTCIDLIKEIHNIPQDFHVFFISGGNNFQYSQVAMNLFKSTNRANYFLSGPQSYSAKKEAEIFGEVFEAAKITRTSYGQQSLLVNQNLNQNVDYTYYCDNDIASGFQYHSMPVDPSVRTNYNQFIAADYSGSFLTKKIDYNNHDIVFASSSYNMGTSGSSIAIVNKRVLDGRKHKKTIFLGNYESYVSDPFPNTPAVYSIHLINLCNNWIKATGGVARWEYTCQKRSQRLYDLIDSSRGVFTNNIDKQFRSNINVTFQLQDLRDELDFLDKASSENMVGLQGDNNFGGIRASLYLPVPDQAIKKLEDFMEDFITKRQ